ncbi:unnamed protein product [Brachionus calyciflorus]|uniref:Uncharacterized protein n=1 Tax=Brachionus calyciflorus TaxID=104777 RepID=A0A813PHR5_9BILA|nr:unnamed protein product [Brachionus calyciflorus]
MINFKSLFFLFCVFLCVHSDLVRIQISNTNNTEWSYDLCGLYRSYFPGEKLNSSYKLQYIAKNDLCQGLNTTNENLSLNAVFSIVRNLSCSVNNLLKDVENASLAMFSLNGPLFLGPNFTEYNIPLIFVPSFKGDEILQFMSDNKSYNSYTISLKLGPAKFDWSIVILLVTAVIIIIVEAWWNLYRFKRFLIKTSNWILSILLACLATKPLFQIGNDLMDLFKITDCKKLVWLCTCISYSMMWLAFKSYSWEWIFLDIILISLVYKAISYKIFTSYIMLIVFLVLISSHNVIMLLILPNKNEKIDQMTSIAFGIGTSFESHHENTDNFNNINFGRSHSKLYMPFFLTIPNISSEKRLCNSLYTYPYTFLGIGDIFLPGFMLNYAIIYDLCKKTKIPIYFIVNLLACCVGFSSVGVILSYVNVIVPVIVVVSPLMMFSSLILSFIKGETVAFLFGNIIKQSIINGKV